MVWDDHRNSLTLIPSFLFAFLSFLESSKSNLVNIDKVETGIQLLSQYATPPGEVVDSTFMTDRAMTLTSYEYIWVNELWQEGEGEKWKNEVTKS